MLNFTLELLDRIEAEIDSNSTRKEALTRLRKLGLCDFGELMICMPNPRFPKLSALLPRMASSEVQNSWTGSSGITLLKQTLDFVRDASYNFSRITGESLEGKKILDFGCGYGRIIRLMHYFSNEEIVYGVDPWDRSIRICQDDGLNQNLFVSDYLPSRLPFPDTKFDLIFAFSVFTHLSEKATIACLNTIKEYVSSNGLILITIRPLEYWDVDQNANTNGVVDEMKRVHVQSGFSFLPHNRDVVDGDITYGDTSMTLMWLEEKFPDLSIMGVDRSLADPYQLYVYLRKNTSENFAI